MKRMSVFICAMVIVFALSACFLFQDKIIRSVGKPISEQLYTHGEFQDYTDYGEYKFDEVDLSDNSYFTRITDDNKQKVLKYIAYYEDIVEMYGLMDASDDIATHYSFERDFITNDDYFCIVDNSKFIEFENFELYYFDSKSSTLYYYHTNL